MGRLTALQPRIGQASAGKSWAHERQSRHERGYGTAWDKLRRVILDRDNWLCRPCLKQGKVKHADEVDHITPKAQGGTDDEANLQPICNECHRGKTQAESAAGGALRSPKR